MKKLSLLLAFLASFAFAGKLVCENGKSVIKMNNGSYIPLKLKESTTMDMPTDMPTNVKVIKLDTISKENLEFDRKVLENCADVKAIREKQKHSSRKLFHN